jgi:secreted trypsin-like serine protease
MIAATWICFLAFFVVKTAAGPDASYNGVQDQVKSSSILGDDGVKGIEGGNDADPGSFTHEVALYSNSGLFICGGSLIAADVVVTAAHCIDYVVTAKIGLYTQTDDSTAESIQICDKVNPLSSTTASGSPRDIALLRLCKPSDLATKGTVKTIKLNDDPNVPKQTQDLVLTGWGASSEYGFLASNLQHLHLTYTTQAVCSKSFKVADSMMCATTVEAGKDACLVADSGGPVVIETDSDNADVLVGIVGWGVDCARPNVPAVYTRVSNRAAWILQEGCKLSKVGPCGIQTTSSSGRRRLGQLEHE